MTITNESILKSQQLILHWPISGDNGFLDMGLSWLGLELSTVRTWLKGVRDFFFLRKGMLFEKRAHSPAQKMEPEEKRAGRDLQCWPDLRLSGGEIRLRGWGEERDTSHDYSALPHSNGGRACCRPNKRGSLTPAAESHGFRSRGSSFAPQCWQLTHGPSQMHYETGASSTRCSALYQPRKGAQFITHVCGPGLY